MVESCIVIGMLCLILFGVLQVSYLIGAKDVISYTALAGARSATIGYNGFMIEKVVRAVSIPTAGPIITPRVRSQTYWSRNDRKGDMWDESIRNEPRLDQLYMEYDAIDDYLNEKDRENLDGILAYENWRDFDTLVELTELDYNNKGTNVTVTVRQHVPLVLPFARTFYSKDMMQIHRSNSDVEDYVPTRRIFQSVELENHADYYLEPL